MPHLKHPPHFDSVLGLSLSAELEGNCCEETRVGRDWSVATVDQHETAGSVAEGLWSEEGQNQPAQQAAGINVIRVFGVAWAETRLAKEGGLLVTDTLKSKHPV